MPSDVESIEKRIDKAVQSITTNVGLMIDNRNTQLELRIAQTIGKEIVRVDESTKSAHKRIDKVLEEIDDIMADSTDTKLGLSNIVTAHNMNHGRRRTSDIPKPNLQSSKIKPIVVKIGIPSAALVGLASYLLSLL